MTRHTSPAGTSPARALRGPHPAGSGALRRSVAAALMLAAVLAAAPPAAAGDLTLIDNSEADSWLEIDRTANLNLGSGTSGSDHDGSAVDLMDTLLNPDRTDDDSEDGG
ncbi:hypothetical protein [Streptomyces sp. SHP 1-2]|uniref:hypothetical protein n=1 Tax=Streptomyces sp. SHP 1-2 TaxID=2769489 RepID=UPI002237958D|nr:hypothetical protein [Streptomyces sp. SHP 1-2]